MSECMSVVCLCMHACTQEVSKRMEGRLTVAKVDTEKYGAIATKYNIQVGDAVHADCHLHACERCGHELTPRTE